MKIISYDIETKDEHLTENGGAFLLDPVILCHCYTFHDTETGYTESKCVVNNRESDLEYMLDLLILCDVIVGSNVMYDLSTLIGWLDRQPKPPSQTGAALICYSPNYKQHRRMLTNRFKYRNLLIHDVLTIERLIDTTSFRVNLETLSQKYLGKTKSNDILLEEALDKGFKESNYMSNLDKLDQENVRRYCMIDTVLAFEIYQKQYEILKDMEYYKQEMETANVLAMMRLTGVPFDEKASINLSSKFEKLIADGEKSLKNVFGVTSFKTDIGKTAMMKYCVEKDLKFSLTLKSGKMALNKDFYNDNLDDENIAMVQNYHKLINYKDNFIDKLRSLAIHSRIYPKIHQMKGDDGGAITGRLSYQLPNLQQVPSKDQLGNEIRSQFTVWGPDYVWIKADYSQQEVKMLLHLASQYKSESAEMMLEKFSLDPTADAYNIVLEVAQNYKSSGNYTRSLMKNLLLAVMYCVGKDTFSRTMRVSVDEAVELLQTFKKMFPFIEEFKQNTIQIVDRRARYEGVAYIETITNRKIYLQTKTQNIKSKANPDKILSKVTSAVDAYKAVNYRVQGSSSDVTKKAMTNLWFKYGICPVLQVHDELDLICHKKDLEYTIETVKECMEKTYPLRIPLTVSIDVQNNWGGV